jgi:hypothetical protein
MLAIYLPSVFGSLPRDERSHYRDASSISPIVVFPKKVFSLQTKID